jgi:hypothetical protein
MLSRIKKCLVYETFIPIQCEEMPNEYLMTATVTDIGIIQLENKVQIVLFPLKHIKCQRPKNARRRGLGPDNKNLGCYGRIN